MAPFIPFGPDVAARLVDTPPDPDWWRTWTKQPGNDGELLHIEVVGSAPPAVLANAAAAEVERRVEVPMLQRGNLGDVVKLRDYQEAAITAIADSWARGKKAPLIVLPTACHAAGQLILMHDGTRRLVEDIAVGDVLMGPDSTPRHVLRLHRGRQEMARVVPIKGAPFTVNMDHVLSLVRTNERANKRYPCQRRGGSIVDVTVREWLGWSKTQKHIHKLFRTGPVEFFRHSTKLPVDPYFIGVYIGDGSASVGDHVAVSKPDDAIRDACFEAARVWGISCRNSEKRVGACPTWHLSRAHSGGRSNPLLDALRDLKLMPLRSTERFIPEAYLLAPIADRMQLLAGLLDTDGYLHNGFYEIVTHSPRLADQLCFLARGLGKAAYTRPTRKSCQTGASDIYHRVTIAGHLDDIPCRIPRKRATSRRMKKDVLRSGFKVELQPTDDYYGFSLDGDGRYVLGDFTVTHNSGKTLVAADLIARVHAATRGKVLFLAHTKELLAQTIDKIRLVSPHTRVGLMKAETLELGREVTVASIQTLQHHTGTSLAKLLAHGPYRLLVIDEAHHAVAAEWLRVIATIKEANPDILMMGMTATPGREDGTGLDLVFDEIAYERNIIEMIQLGWLVPPRLFRARIDVDLDRVKLNKNGEYIEASLSTVMNTPPVNAAVVRAWREFGHDRKHLVYAVSIEHAEALAAEFNSAGYPATFVHSEMKKKDRELALQRFRDGDVKLLCSVNAILEGYDDPSAEGILLARPTQSQTVHIQAVGRGLRLFPGKTECLVIDCVGNSLKHQPVQLASLFGLEPAESKDAVLGAAEDELENPDEPKVINARVHGEEVQFYRRTEESKYTWRETTFGWLMQIPLVGYYLVAWSDKSHTKATIKFFDQRKGKRDSLPREVLRDPVEFEMAYGLVESECDRFFRARGKRGDALEEDDDMTASSFVDLDEGTDEEVGPEAWVLKDQAWRTKSISAPQYELLEKLGVKPASMPDTAGEASDLITVLRAAKDQKMRVPATQKQLAYLYTNKLPIEPNMTKGAAATLIWKHRKQTEGANGSQRN